MEDTVFSEFFWILKNFLVLVFCLVYNKEWFSVSSIFLFIWLFSLIWWFWLKFNSGFSVVEFIFLISVFPPSFEKSIFLLRFYFINYNYILFMFLIYKKNIIIWNFNWRYFLTLSELITPWFSRQSHSFWSVIPILLI